MAVLAVVVYHLKIFALPAGFLGVDIFFVLSGYLIATLTFKELLETENFSFSNFYLRRVRRIMPALFAMLLCTLLAGHFILLGEYRDEFAKSAIAALLSFSNIFFYATAGYWDFSSSMKPLLHTWSLGVEEQFYFIFPAIAFFLYIKKKLSQARSFLFFLFLSIVSLLLCFITNTTVTDFCFYWLPTRLWELTVGVCLAAYNFMNPIKIGKKTSAALSVVALCTIIGCLRLGKPGVGIANVLVVSSTAILLLPPFNVVDYLLSRKPCVFLGKISYSLYLWHWPVWVLWNFRKMHPPRLSDSLTVLCISLVIAFLSWKYVESPFRKMTAWRQVLKKLAIPLGACCALATISILLPQNLKIDVPPACSLQVTEFSAARINDDKVLHFGPEGGPEFALIGDSLAMAIAPAFKQLCDLHAIPAAYMARSSTLALTGAYQPARGYQDAAFAMIDYIKRHDIKTVVISQRWSAYATERDVFVEKISAALSDLLDAGKTVFILEEVPTQPGDKLYILALSGETGSKISGNRPNAIKEIVEKLDNPRLRFISLHDRFIQNDEYIFANYGKLLYRDAIHINAYGAKFAEPALAPFFNSLIAGQNRR